MSFWESIPSRIFQKSSSHTLRGSAGLDPLKAFCLRFLRGGCSRGGVNWGTLRFLREDQENHHPALRILFNKVFGSLGLVKEEKPSKRNPDQSEAYGKLVALDSFIDGFVNGKLENGQNPPRNKKANQYFMI